MSWTKKHFELVAKTVDETIKDKEIKTNVCRAFSNKFVNENPMFDEGRFMGACRGK